MSKFPQNEWVEIDGQRVPFTKPQHYVGDNNEEVRLTGEKDPLPVKNTEKKSVEKIVSHDIDYSKVDKLYNTACLNSSGWVRYNAKLDDKIIRISDFKDLFIAISNNQDVEITNLRLLLGVDDDVSRYEFIDRWGIRIDLGSISAGETLKVTSEKYPEIEGPWKYVTVWGNFGEPKEGSVSTRIYGVNR